MGYFQLFQFLGYIFQRFGNMADVSPPANLSCSAWETPLDYSSWKWGMNLTFPIIDRY